MYKLYNTTIVSTHGHRHKQHLLATPTTKQGTNSCVDPAVIGEHGGCRDVATKERNSRWITIPRNVFVSLESTKYIGRGNNTFIFKFMVPIRS